MRAPRVAAAAVLLVLLGLASLSALQDGSRTIEGQTTPPPAPPVRRTAEIVIDGAVNPELIPDEVMASTLVRQWAIPTNATQAEEKRFASLMARLGVGPADLRIVRTELSRVHETIRALEEELKTTKDFSAAAPLMRSLRETTTETYYRLLEFLSPDGRAKLRARVADAKRSMQVFRSTPPSRQTPD